MPGLNVLLHIAVVWTLGLHQGNLKMKESRVRTESREEGGGRAGTGWKEEGGFQRHSSVLTGAKHGKLD